MIKMYDLLEWDSDHFGFKVASFSCEKYGIEEIKLLLDDLRQEGVRLAYFISGYNVDFSRENKLCECVKLVDKKTTYVKNIINNTKSYEIKNRVNIYEKKIVCADLLRLAIQSGVYSRFNIDNNINHSSFESLYKKWIKKSVNNGDEEVYVVHRNSSIAGMVTVSVEEDCGVIGLLSVEEQSRGQGIGKDLMLFAIERFKTLKCKNVKVITQQDNIAACRLYEAMGFDVRQVSFFYHFWL